MALRDKPNADLFRLYDDELVLHLNNPKNLRTARKLLDDFRQYLGEASPSPEGAKGFLARFSHLSSGTRAWYTLAIKGFMKWYGLPLEDLRVKVAREIPPYIETKDVLKLLEAAGDKRSHKDIIERDMLLIETLWRTGLRRAEAANLCRRNIVSGKIFVRKGKGEKDRVVPLLPSLEQKLVEFSRDMPPTQPIFGLTEGAISNKILTIARRAGLTGMHTHALRHKFATDLLEKGVNIRVVQVLMGHENLDTTQVYLSFTDEQLVDAINRLTEEAPERETTQPTVKVFEATTTLEIIPVSRDWHGNPIESYVWALFELELAGPNVEIESLIVQTSDAKVAFIPGLFYSELSPEVDDFEADNLLPVDKPVRKKTYQWTPARSFPYKSEKGENRCYGAVSIGQRPLRFDINPEKEPEKWREYYNEPVELKIILRYHPDTAARKEQEITL